MLEIIILVVIFVGGVNSHSYGADLQACDTMKPGHAGVLRQRTRSPYTIQTNNRFYVPCQTQPIMGRQMTCGVIVRITARNRNSMNGQFKGFLLQARSRNVNGQIMNVGEFRYMNENPVLVRSSGNPNLVRPGGVLTGGIAMGQIGRFPGQTFPGRGLPGTMNNMISSMNVVVQRMNCPRGFSVTHTENRPKNEIMLKWYPPVGFNQPVQFIATVVRDYRTYWMNHRSFTLRPNRRPQASAQVAQTMRWNSATRATSGLVVFFTTLSCLLLVLL